MPADEVDLSSPHVKALIKAYNDGSWVDGEERILEYDVDTVNAKATKDEVLPEKPKREQILDSILDSEAFNTVLLKYFEKLKKA